VKRHRYVTIAPAVLLVAAAGLLSACDIQAASGEKKIPLAATSGAANGADGSASLIQVAASPATASMSTSSAASASRKGTPSQSPSARKTAAAGAASTPTGSASSLPPPDPSGQSLPVGDLPGWKQVFYDDFQGDSVSIGQFAGCSSSTETCSDLPQAMQSKWFDYPDGWLDTTGNCEYEPSQTLSVSGGILNMFIHTSSSGACMAAAPVAKLLNGDSSNGQLYGMYSVRMRSNPVTGYLAAFLLWPDSEIWPQDGEIDFPDGSLTGGAGGFMHYQGATSGSAQDAYISNTSFSDWHTYTLEWTPSYVKFLIDGQVLGDSTNASEIPDTPMHWVMQTESDLNVGKPPASAQGNLQIAWAAVWSYDPSTS
jgi:Glycosyl hydrolases family 16